MMGLEKGGFAEFFFYRVFFSVPPKAAENVGTCFRRMIASGTNPVLCWHPYPKQVGRDSSWILSPLQTELTLILQNRPKGGVEVTKNRGDGGYEKKQKKVGVRKNPKGMGGYEQKTEGMVVHSLA